jgi:glycine hydroxymethyltransferase
MPKAIPAAATTRAADHRIRSRTLAIERAKQSVRCGFANVQPHSARKANGAVMMALLKPGDTIMGMSLAAGGHPTHGAPPAQSGKWFNAVQYGVRPDDHLVDFDEVEGWRRSISRKLIIAGGSAYPGISTSPASAPSADEVGALSVCRHGPFCRDWCGRASIRLPSGTPTSSTDQRPTRRLRGPRGGMVLTDDETIAKKVNSAVFPGLQGGPLMHVIAAKAVAFGEALEPGFKTYAKAVIKTAQTACQSARRNAVRIGRRAAPIPTLRWSTFVPLGVTGADADQSLEHAGITCNKNGVPFDPLPPVKTSGIRVGSPAGTTRGFGEDEFRDIADMVADVLDGLQKNGVDNNGAVEQAVGERVRTLCARFPIYEG